VEIILLLLLPYVALVIASVLLLRDLSTGSATVTGQIVKRASNPPLYWSIMFLYVAIAAFALFVAYKVGQNGTMCPIFVDRCDYQIEVRSM
jgi:hypothetical protein